jgi:hypothetical protein
LALRVGVDPVVAFAVSSLEAGRGEQPVHVVGSDAAAAGLELFDFIVETHRG